MEGSTLRAVSAQRFAQCLFALCVGFLVVAAVHFAYRERTNARCVDQLTQVAAALDRYATEHENYPNPGKIHGGLFLETDDLYPVYMSERFVLDDESYYYLGYLIVHERSGLTWIEEYRECIPEGKAIPDRAEIWSDCAPNVELRGKEFNVWQHWNREIDRRNGREVPPWKSYWDTSKPLPDQPNPSEECLFIQLRLGSERAVFKYMPQHHLIGNPDAERMARSMVPLMFERPERHGDGGHVLYMDGHLEFVPYPGKFPMTPAFIDGLRSLDAMEKSN